MFFSLFRGQFFFYFFYKKGIMQLFSADAKVFSKFFWPKKVKKRASKVAHNQPRPFYFTVQPRSQPKIDFSYYEISGPEICSLICDRHLCFLMVPYFSNYHRVASSIPLVLLQISTFYLGISFNYEQCTITSRWISNLQRLFAIQRKQELQKKRNPF